MPSPFPGMDPWLEQPSLWPGVHSRLIVAISARLNQLLPDHLVADIDQYVYIRESEDESDSASRRLEPDVFVPGNHSQNGSYPHDPVAVAEPTCTTTLSQREKGKRRYIRIQTIDGERLLTVIEILSPSNKKSGPDRDAYLQKRREYFADEANLVEIDLLRAGSRLPMGRPRPADTDYYVFETRHHEYPKARVWAFSKYEKIPIVPVPLDSENPAIPLDLRTCLDLAYDDGKCGTRIDYRKPPDPPFDKHDSEWAAKLLERHAKKKPRK